MPKPKHEIVTFKVDQALWDALRGIPNRSEFIRAAILVAMDSVCPLCKGSGILSPDQRRHWEQFAKKHPLQECDDCHAVHPVCVVQDDGVAAPWALLAGLGFVVECAVIPSTAKDLAWFHADSPLRSELVKERGQANRARPQQKCVACSRRY
jgi:hypothetical protein